MPRPVKWSRDLRSIQDRATQSRTETWSRTDIEYLFGISRASSQTLMKAIGDVQVIGGAHFIERTSLLEFLNEMIAADSVEAALQQRLAAAEPTPRQKPLRVTLPANLRNAMLPDLPSNITLGPGRLEIRADSAVVMLESLVTLATIMGNDLERFRAATEIIPYADEIVDDLQAMFERMRTREALL